MAGASHFLNNTGIYFDFNAPIVTNTVKTVVDVLEVVVAPESVWKIEAYPNPSELFVQFNIEDSGGDQYGFELYDLQGRLVRSIDGLAGSGFRVDRDGLPAGIYAFCLNSETGKAASGKLIFR